MPPIHLAAFLKVRQQEYYDALWEVQVKLNWAPWVRLFLESAIASCRHTVLVLETLRSLQQQWRTLLTEKRRRRDAAIWRVIDLPLGQPIVTVNAVARRLEVSFPAANQAVEELVVLDVLRPMNDYKRHRVFQAHQVTNALYTGLGDSRLLRSAFP